MSNEYYCFQNFQPRLPEKRRFKGKYASLRTSNFQGATMRPIVPKHRHIVTTKFSSLHQFRNYIKLSSTFLDESREIQKLKTDKNPIQFQLTLNKPICL